MGTVSGPESDAHKVTKINVKLRQIRHASPEFFTTFHPFRWHFY